MRPSGPNWTAAGGYRRLTTYAASVGRPRSGSRHAAVGWTGPDVSITGRLGSEDTTAQVNPAAFTEGMMREAVARGAVLRLGEVTGLLRQGERVHGALVDGDTIEADAVVIAMGPWSILAARWLPLPTVFGLKGHSLVFATADAVPPQALFVEAEDVDGLTFSPEVFPRADGTTYVCAISSETPLPIDPGDVAPDVGALDRLKRLCARISPVLTEARIVASGACFRPVTSDGLPLIGPVPGTTGAFVATGHSVWGILNAPATGEAIADLLLDGVSRVDLARFDPARLKPVDARSVRTSTSLGSMPSRAHPLPI